MIVQKVHLYEKKVYKPPVYVPPSITDADVENEVRRATEAGIYVGAKYKTKYNFEVTVDSLGRPTKLKSIYFSKNKPSVVQCMQKGQHGNFPTQYGVDEILEMEPL